MKNKSLLNRNGNLNGNSNGNNISLKVKTTPTPIDARPPITMSVVNIDTKKILLLVHSLSLMSMILSNPARWNTNGKTHWQRIRFNVVFDLVEEKFWRNLFFSSENRLATCQVFY